MMGNAAGALGGMKSLSKLGGFSKGLDIKKPGIKAPDVHEEHEGHETVISHQPDGSFHVKHADGEESEHPDHLHALTSIAHKMTDGDKHHMTHHEMSGESHSHGIHESGEHAGTHDHENLDELKDSFDKFVGEEGEEGHGDEEANGEDEGSDHSFGGF